mmetsp:Transcript_10541/g.39202  ORF Transcript_10541/g.39202 Transcript_10541/m.39202 type:complete len:259 (+) Transcript_10541:33-809(+)
MIVPSQFLKLSPVVQVRHVLVVLKRSVRLAAVFSPPNKDQKSQECEEDAGTAANSTKEKGNQKECRIESTNCRTHARRSHIARITFALLWSNTFSMSSTNVFVVGQIFTAYWQVAFCPSISHFRRADASVWTGACSSSGAHLLVIGQNSVARICKVIHDMAHIDESRSICCLEASLVAHHNIEHVGFLHIHLLHLILKSVILVGRFFNLSVVISILNGAHGLKVLGCRFLMLHLQIQNIYLIIQNGVRETRIRCGLCH